MNVDELSDREAVRVLALVVDHGGPVPDDRRLREVGERLREAAADPELDIYYDPALPPAQDGELARTALTHIAATPQRAEVVRRAIGIAADERSNRFVGLETVVVVALIVVALQTEVEFARTSTGRWRLRIHKAAMSDSTLAAVLTKVVGALRGGSQ